MPYRLASKCGASCWPGSYRITVGASNDSLTLPGMRASAALTYAFSPTLSPRNTHDVLVRIPCSCASLYLTHAPAPAPSRVANTTNDEEGQDMGEMKNAGGDAGGGRRRGTSDESLE